MHRILRHFPFWCKNNRNKLSTHYSYWKTCWTVTFQKIYVHIICFCYVRNQIPCIIAINWKTERVFVPPKCKHDAEQVREWESEWENEWKRRERKKEEIYVIRKTWFEINLDAYKILYRRFSECAHWKPPYHEIY